LALMIPLAKTYDLSWDGQGYHQTAVIALANGWNPIRSPAIQLRQHLPSQIYAEGYPSALWEIEASMYSMTGKINTAKVVNVLIGFVAVTVIYCLLRKMSFGKLLSAAISVLAAFQPVYVLQLLTFMGDGFGYQLLLIASAALTIAIISPKAYWTIGIFLIAEIFLVSTKYSHLPVAFILAFIFALVVLNRFLNKEYLFHNSTKIFICGIIVLSVIFAYVPYIRNGLAHNALFYPTNIPELMGGVRYNNIPANLRDKDRLTLLFYGMFSRAQSAESGDTRSPKNIVELKIPFTFSMTELKDSASLFNNRAGAGGPLYSGIVVLSIIFLMYCSFKAKNRNERYAVYTSYFCIAVILFLSLLSPTPNLLRFVNQLQIVPFAVLVPLYTAFKKVDVRLFTFFILLLVCINTSLYSGAVIQKNWTDTKQINEQFSEMRGSGKSYEVRAQHHYSSYIVLTEQQIPFTLVNTLRCHDIEALFASSTTTQYCTK
jgi:hypothetical protein